MTDTIKQNPQAKPNTPIVLNDGSVVAKIWRNESEKGGVFYNVTLGKLYTDKQSGETRETSSLQKQDLLSAQFLLRECYGKISELQQQHRNTENRNWLEPPNQAEKPSGNEPDGSAPHIENGRGRTPDR